MPLHTEVATAEFFDWDQTEKAVRASLRGNSYPAIRRVSYECRSGTVLLRGQLTSYHLRRPRTGGFLAEAE